MSDVVVSGSADRFGRTFRLRQGGYGAIDQTESLRG